MLDLNVYRIHLHLGAVVAVNLSYSFTSAMVGPKIKRNMMFNNLGKLTPCIGSEILVLS